VQHRLKSRSIIVLINLNVSYDCNAGEFSVKKWLRSAQFAFCHLCIIPWHQQDKTPQRHVYEVSGQFAPLEVTFSEFSTQSCSKNAVSALFAASALKEEADCLFNKGVLTDRARCDAEK